MGAAIQLNRLGYENLLILERESDVAAPGTSTVPRPGCGHPVAPTRTPSSPTPTGRGCSHRVPSSALRRHVADTYDLRATCVRPRGHRRSGREQRTDGVAPGPCTVTAKYLLTPRVSLPAEEPRSGGSRVRRQVIHTTDWDDSYDLVASARPVIGTGATAVQLIPRSPRSPPSSPSTNAPDLVSPKLDFPVPRPSSGVRRAPVHQRIARLAGTAVLER